MKTLVSLILIWAMFVSSAYAMGGYYLSPVVEKATTEGVNDWKPSTVSNVPFNGTGYQVYSPSLRDAYMGYPSTRLAVHTTTEPNGFMHQAFVDYDSWWKTFWNYF